MTENHTFFMLLRPTRHWRELSAAEQRDIFEDTFNRVFNGYPGLRMSRYAVDGQAARCTDLLVWEAADPAEYHEAIAALAQQPIFGAPLFEIVEVIAGTEDRGCGEASKAPLAMLAL